MTGDAGRGMAEAPASSGKAHAWRLCLIFLLGAVLYVNVLAGPFLYDDVTEILSNPRVHRLSAIPDLIALEFWTDAPGWPSLHRPVTAATIPLLFVLGDGASWPFHLANLLLHGIVSMLLAAIVMRLTGRSVPALVAGVLFAVHPIHTEAVAWISGRSELLYAASGATAWWCHLRAREGKNPGYAGLWPANQTCGPEARVRRVLWTAAAALMLAVSLGSKETAICWPLHLPGGRPPLSPRRGLSARAPKPRAVRDVLRRRPRVARVALQHPRPSGASPLPGDLPLQSSRCFSLVAGVPLHLDAADADRGGERVVARTACIDYGYDQVPIAQGPLHVDIAIAAAALAALFWWGARVMLKRDGADPVNRLMLLGAMVALLSWIPVSSFLLPSIVIFAERTLYLPVFGWCVAAGVVAEALCKRFPARRGALVAAGILLTMVPAGLTVARGALYLDPLALFAAGAANCHRSANAHVLHAAALEEAGRDAEAAAALRAALTIAPHHADARVALAGALARLGRTDEAAREVHAALEETGLALETRLAAVDVLHATGEEETAGGLLATIASENPDDLRVMFAQGRALLGLGRTPEALGAFNALTSSHPDSPFGHDGAGAALMALHRDEEAEASFLRALERDPYDTNALYNLGLMLLRSGAAERVAEAERLLARYLRVMPSDAAIWAQLARAREALGDSTGALEARRRAGFEDRRFNVRSGRDPE